MKVTITTRHLNKAIKEVDENKRDGTTHCLVAQAVKPIFKKNFYYCGTSLVAFKKGRHIDLDATAKELVRQFDSKMYDAIRAKLPLTITLPDLPKRKAAGK